MQERFGGLHTGKSCLSGLMLAVARHVCTGLQRVLLSRQSEELWKGRPGVGTSEVRRLPSVTWILYPAIGTCLHLVPSKMSFTGQDTGRRGARDPHRIHRGNVRPCCGHTWHRRFYTLSHVRFKQRTLRHAHLKGNYFGRAA